MGMELPDVNINTYNNILNPFKLRAEQAKQAKQELEQAKAQEAEHFKYMQLMILKFDSCPRLDVFLYLPDFPGAMEGECEQLLDKLRTKFNWFMQLPKPKKLLTVADVSEYLREKCKAHDDSDLSCLAFDVHAYEGHDIGEGGIPTYYGVLVKKAVVPVDRNILLRRGWVATLKSKRVLICPDGKLGVYQGLSRTVVPCYMNGENNPPTDLVPSNDCMVDVDRDGEKHSFLLEAVCVVNGIDVRKT